MELKSIYTGKTSFKSKGKEFYLFKFLDIQVGETFKSFVPLEIYELDIKLMSTVLITFSTYISDSRLNFNVEHIKVI